MSELIREDTDSIIHRMASEIIFEEGSGFERAFFDFLVHVRKFTLTEKFNEEKFGAAKALVLDIYDKIKNSKLIFGVSTENFENQLNEVIYSTKLNKVKSLKTALCEELFEIYNELNKILSFEFSYEKNDKYHFWCFLKLARLIRTIYEKEENNIINKDFTFNSSDEPLKFIFKNKDGSLAELLYNYKSILKDKNLIYLIVKKQGYEPVSFAFTCEEDNLHYLRDSLCNNKNNENCFLFSGIYYLSNDDFASEAEYEKTKKNKLGKINFTPANTAIMSDLLSRIAVYKTAVSECITTAEISERIKKYEFERRNMLVSTVKSKEQLEINLKHNFYYMPLFQLQNTTCNYEYISIYQSATNFGDCSGILYYGEIEDVRIVKRSEITELPKDSDELYLRFSINWKIKDEKIKPDSPVKAFLETSNFIFEKAENTSELFIKTYEEYKVYSFLKSTFKNVKIYVSETGITEIKADDFRFEFNSVGMTIYKNSDFLSGMSRYTLKKNLKSVFNYIKNLQ